MTHHPLLKLNDEVRAALREDQPIVALESNVICHGLPYPANIDTACELNAAVRAAGAVPAMIAIENGQFLIGMTDQQIEEFGTHVDIPKTTSRDLPVLLASGRRAATTVASSLVAAELAGVKFFSSAGIGGVHRGAQHTMDISADLFQFTRSRVVVVCAGAKNILDLGLTLEYLETHSVPIIAYQSDEFPAFYCRSSGLKSPHRLDTFEAIARSIDYHWQLGAPGAVLVTIPIDEDAALDQAEIEGVLNDALRHAEASGTRGGDVTPQLMRALERATGGRTTRANQAVLLSNARQAAELAVTHAQSTAPALQV